MSINELRDEAQIKRAKEFLNKGRLEEARSLLAAICGDGQEDLEAWSLYSTANGYLERYEDVIAACRKMLQIEPDYLPALNNLASAFAALGRNEEAVAQFQQLLELAPDNPAVLNNYGRSLALMGRQVAARGALEKAVQIQPHYVEARFNLALMLENSGEYTEALLHYQEIATIKPGLPGLNERLNRVRALVQQSVG